MNIDTVCMLLINALKDAGYNDSTIFNYQGAVRRFKTFCKEHNAAEYKAVLSGLLTRTSGPVSLFLRPLQGQDCNRRMRIIEKSTRITVSI